jgi:pyruvate carboxylase
MWAEAGALVIGPGPDILSRTGDKLMARLLAEECQVPVLPALQTPTSDIDDLQAFGSSVGYPVIIKAVDGGGGRGIRIVRKEEDLAPLAKRALQESPSGKAFAEKAAIDGYKHVEVQIIGDGKGNVRHLWERECSIQRRFQKVVEFAPSSITDRRLVGEVIRAALRMARKVRANIWRRISLTGTGELLISGDIRISRSSFTTRVLFSRGKSSFTSGTYHYRIPCIWH